MCRLNYIGKKILRASRILDVGEEECPPFLLEAPTKLTGNTGFAHTPLSSQQRMVALKNPCFEHLQLGFPVEEVVAAHPSDQWTVS